MVEVLITTNMKSNTRNEGQLHCVGTSFICLKRALNPPQTPTPFALLRRETATVHLSRISDRHMYAYRMQSPDDFAQYLVHEPRPTTYFKQI